MSQGQDEKCKHQGCNCSVPAGKEYCSEHCERAAASRPSSAQGAQKACGCGHSACA